ncbi:Caulimovirus viroplasmin-domain-containing protein [Apiosordaria backusii]|uniref:Ribonuclease H n=1 Tax=Apiosordaria backusii TaxID=314023 RepID=A0AA40K626_9PEZI|nr:Caulimovirus viroplasmin-domain-containing protein [Apiosordaria backusii]
MAQKKWYAVANGHQPGVYESWAEAKAQVEGYSHNCYQSFTKREEAERFVEGYKETRAELMRARGSQREESRGRDERVEVQPTPTTSPAPATSSPLPPPSPSSFTSSTGSIPRAHELVVPKADASVMKNEADIKPATPAGGRKKGYWRSRNRGGHANKGSSGGGLSGVTENMGRLDIRMSVSRV